MTRDSFLRGWLLLAPLLLLAAPVGAQSAPDEDEKEILETPEDPFTKGDPERMAAAGIVSYGPFPWADTHRTEDIDRVLGPGRILWLETGHFRIGSTLQAIGLPAKPEQRKQLAEELRALHDRLPTVPERPRRLGAWLRLHLYAQRAERLYAEIADLLGFDGADAKGTHPPDGPHLGLPGKHLLLLLQKESDMARFLERFLDARTKMSFRYYHAGTHQMLLVSTVEGVDEIDGPGFQSHVTYSVAHNLISSYRGYTYTLPTWLVEGLAHWYARHVETEFINVTVDGDDMVAAREQHKWHKKVRARAQHDGASIPFATMRTWRRFEDLDYQGHIQSWSRVDYLMQLDRKKLGMLVHRLKSLPAPPAPGAARPDSLDLAQEAALRELFGLDDATFDRRWREWVLKTYPKR